jgi:AAA15 family ATPase/GTPase
MPYLHTLGLENFRLFKEKVVFDFAPITILTGQNSSGKSSLIKSLLLMKGSVKETGSFDELNFSGGRHNLVSYDQVINNQNNKKEITFTFDLPLRQIEKKSFIDITYRQHSENLSVGIIHRVKVYTEADDLILQIEIREGGDRIENPENELEKAYQHYPYTLVNVKSNLAFLYLELNKMFNKLSEEIEYRIRGIEYGSEKYKVMIDRLFPKRHRMNFDPEINYHTAKIFKEFHLKEFPDQNVLRQEQNFNLEDNPEDSELKKFKKRNSLILKEGITFKSILQDWSSKAINEILKTSISEILSEIGIEDRKRKMEEERSYGVIDFYSFLLQDFLNREIVYSLSNIKYLLHQIDSISSSRANPSRFYFSNEVYSEVNKIVLEFSQLKLADYNKVKKFIDYSFQLFEIGEEIVVKSVQGVFSEITIKKEGKEYFLADLGYGYSQLIPIILKVAMSKIQRLKTNTFLDNPYLSPLVILLEEPESNLHPSLQSKLAEFIFRSANEFNIQFIIETHSEYFIRNFQYLVARKDLAPEGIKILYFHRPGSVEFNKSPYKEINIKEDGRLSSEFGEGFLDEIPRLLSSLYNSSSN